MITMLYSQFGCVKGHSSSILPGCTVHSAVINSLSESREKQILAQRIRTSDISAQVRNSYLTHVILPKLSHVGCSLVGLKLTHFVIK